MKRWFGAESPEVAAFKSKCAECYDGRFAYRFFYKLRNYSQHCGFPPVEIRVRRTEEKTEIWADVDVVKLCLDYDEWGPRLTDELFDLAASAARVNIQECLRSVMTCLYEIGSVVRQQEESLIDDCRVEIDRLWGRVSAATPAEVV